VRNDSLAAADLRPDSVGSSEVANFSLNDEDIGQTTVVNFTGTIGNVPANSCVEDIVTGVNARGDHLLLTPQTGGALVGQLIYSAYYRTGDESMTIKTCNPRNSAISNGTTNFNLLVIDAL
jgi:hypothetical protein